MLFIYLYISIFIFFYTSIFKIFKDLITNAKGEDLSLPNRVSAWLVYPCNNFSMHLYY